MESGSRLYVGLLDLPVGSAISLNGCPIVLQRDDFVGFVTANENGGLKRTSSTIELVTIRAGSTSKEKQGPAVPSSSAIAVAFVLPPSPLPLIRRFNPTTEEVSATPVDQATEQSLAEHVAQGRIDPQRIVDYNKLSRESKERWRGLTSFVSSTLLENRGIQEGEKIVPGSFDEDKVESSTKLVDGKAANYPSIPIINPSSSIRHSQHVGTKRFLSQLDPSRRTELFMDPDPTRRLLRTVLSEYYRDDWRELFGDFQLAYVLFLNLHCYASLSHWRDLVALLSSVGVATMKEQSALYSNLLDVLTTQVATVDEDFFEDAEMSGDNFLVPALSRLLSGLSHLSDDTIASKRTNLCRLLEGRFPGRFNLSLGEGENGMDVDEDEGDGPVVVATEDMAASAYRLSAASARSATRNGAVVEEYSQAVRNQYPLLFAARTPSEDILMTCARVLDDASDVSLVREAANYLEQVEAAKK